MIARWKAAARWDAWLVFLVALVIRIALVAWAASRFAPAADGTFYDIVGRRIAEGHGYTWLWPDGAVTFAAHYPVGYPALLGLAYATLGAHAWTGMLVNALLGALGAGAVQRILQASSSRGLAVGGGLVMALHPALLLYTPALMTEGVTASVLALAVAMATGLANMRPERLGRRLGVVGLGVLVGMTTLVRPQVILMAPVLGFLVGVRRDLRSAALTACVVLFAALATCAPWTVRNCVRMNRCALVSVNGGWNLAIGTETTSGAWTELKVPERCKEVFDEAGKDACFGSEAKAEILAHPAAWLAKIPAKLRVTFDYFGAAPWYLHASNPSAFSLRAKVIAGAIETVVSRFLVALALWSMASWPGKHRRLRRATALVGIVFAALPAGVMAYLALAVGTSLLGPRALARAPIVVSATLALLVATAAIHAVFFGAGRYGLLVVPFVTALAFVRHGDEPCERPLQPRAG